MIGATSAIISFLYATVGQGTAGTGKVQHPPYTPEEQKIHDKIVKDLLTSFSESGRVDGVNIPTAYPKQKSQKSQYAVIFRQSRSWGIVEKLLKEVDTTHPKIKKWVVDWENRIRELRRIHGEIEKSSKELEKIDAERNALKASRELTGLTALQWKKFKQREEPHKKTIGEHLTKLREILKEGGEASNAIDPKLCELNARFKKVYNYLGNYWPSLVLFSQWKEISPDDEGKIFVVVRRPTQDLRDTLDRTMKNPLEKMVDIATKAIFIIEETKQVEFPITVEQDGEEKTGKISRPSQVSIKHKQLAPLTPNPLNKHSSNYEVCDEIIFNHPFPAGSKTAQPRSETAMRLQYIVLGALREVNRELSRITKPDDITISDKLKEEEQAEARGGMPYTFRRYVVNFIPPEIPKMLFGN